LGDEVVEQAVGQVFYEPAGFGFGEAGGFEALGGFFAEFSPRNGLFSVLVAH
jgi:hypothetical protein